MYRKITITKKYLSRMKNSQYELTCRSEKCPAPKLGMNIGDMIIAKSPPGIQYHVYHLYCALRHNIEPSNK